MFCRWPRVALHCECICACICVWHHLTLFFQSVLTMYKHSFLSYICHRCISSSSGELILQWGDRRPFDFFEKITILIGYAYSVFIIIVKCLYTQCWQREQAKLLVQFQLLLEDLKCRARLYCVHGCPVGLVRVALPLSRIVWLHSLFFQVCKWSNWIIFSSLY